MTRSFQDLGLSDPTLAALREAGFDHPTPVQAAAVPEILAGHDLIIQAQTGTGKTAAFALPIIEKVEPTPGRIQALVLAPTRELAAQVARETERLGSHRGIRAAAIYGGAGFEPQLEALKQAQVVIATPGRLLDHLRRRNISLADLTIFGLDEADEMLSMGFEKDVFDVVSFLPGDKQCFVCSATINDPILRLANGFLRNPQTIDLSSDSVGARSVQHRYFAVDEAAKLEALRRVLPTWAPEGAIVFANTKVATFRIHDALAADDLPVGVINGDLPQSEREKALARMRDDRTKYLVATDVAARGIDISGLPAVVNYDMPDSPDNYVHRTGRTGRAGQFGIALSLVTPADISVFHYLEKFYRIRQQRTPLPGIDDVRRTRADRSLIEALDGLDADGSLPYADYLAIARRLAEIDGGHRTIAKLIAAFRHAPTSGSLKQHPQEDAPVLPAKVDPTEDAVVPPAAHPEAPETETPETEAARSDAPRGVEQDPAAAPTVADAAPAPARTTRKRASRRDADSSVPAAVDTTPTRSTPAPEAPTTDPHPFEVSAEAAAIHAWLDQNSGADGRERMRSVRSIASGVSMPMKEVRRHADDHPDLEVTGQRRSMVRILDGAAATPEPTKQPTERRPEADAAAPADQGPQPDQPPVREPKTRETRSRSRRPAATASESAKSASPRSASPRSAPRDRKAETIFDRKGQFRRFRINVGSEKAAAPEELADIMARLAGLERDDLGQIDLHPEHCVVEVSEIYAREFHDALHRQTWRDVQLDVKRA